MKCHPRYSWYKAGDLVHEHGRVWGGTTLTPAIDDAGGSSARVGAETPIVEDTVDAAVGVVVTLHRSAPLPAALAALFRAADGAPLVGADNANDVVDASRCRCYAQHEKKARHGTSGGNFQHVLAAILPQGRSDKTRAAVAAWSSTRWQGQESGWR